MADITNAFVLLANFVLVPGLAYGSQLALGALGVTLVFGVLRFAHLAHGDLAAFGTMVTVLLTGWLQANGVTAGALPTALIALPAGILAGVAIALALDRSVYAYYRRRRAKPVVLMIASVGVMFVLNGVVRMVVGPDTRHFADGARFVIHARDFRDWTGLAEGLSLRAAPAITIVVALAVMIALFRFLRRTRLGKTMRAYSDNEDLSRLCGVYPDRVVTATWVIAAALATVAGVLYGLDKAFSPFTYFQLLVPTFAAVILGGIGHPLGAVIGGYLIAFSEVGLTYAYRGFLRYLAPDTWSPDGLVQLLSTEYKVAISFLILVGVLLVRPTGILGARAS